jgi:hypothetical protein
MRFLEWGSMFSIGLIVGHILTDWRLGYQCSHIKYWLIVFIINIITLVMCYFKWNKK